MKCGGPPIFENPVAAVPAIGFLQPVECNPPQQFPQLIQIGNRAFGPVKKSAGERDRSVFALNK
jgi:hypothetical protein